MAVRPLKNCVLFSVKPLKPHAQINTQTIDLDNDPVYQKALKEISSFGFHQREKIGDLFPTVYCMKQAPEYRRYWPYLKVSFDWFMIPSAIWAAEFILVTAFLVDLIKKGKPLPPALILIYMFAQKLPSKHIQKLAKQRQAMAHKGEYDDLLKNNDIYLAHCAAVHANPELGKALEMMKAVFDMDQFANEIGVVRRYIIGERGFRIDWKFDPNDPESMMRTALTLLSSQHDLYGFQKDEALIQKFTAQLTAFGTVMVSPKYQADFARDINRKTLGTFPRAYGVAFKGAKRIIGQREREDEAIRTCMAVLSADELGLLGKDRRLYIIEQAGLPHDIERRKIRKLANAGRKLLGIE